MNIALIDRLHAILSEDYDGTRHVAVERCDSEPSSRLSAREGDLRAWGLVYGLAFGILSAEERPESDRDELADEALEAARVAFAQWNGLISPRAISSPPIDDVLLAYEDVEEDLALALEDSPALEALDAQLRALRDAVGMPEVV